MCGIAFACVQEECDVISRIEPNVRRRGPDEFEVHSIPLQQHRLKLVFASSLLQLRGHTRRAPLRDLDNDSGPRILLYNGEVYEGLPGLDRPEVNDGEQLFEALGSGEVAVVMSRLRGPWAFIYYDCGVLWWGRDVMGRKSLLMVREGSGLVLTSVSQVAPSKGSMCVEVVPGLYRASLEDIIRGDPAAFIRVAWEDKVLAALADYGRTNVVGEGDGRALAAGASQQLLDLLSEAVAKRCATTNHPSIDSDFSSEKDARFMVLFSGGVDSTLIAGLLHKALPAHEPIELCSICFTADGTSPDRLGALDAYEELKSLFPDRRWKFIAVEGTYGDLRSQKDKVMTLLRPHDSVMDFNIGGALWLASAGVGRLIDVCLPTDDNGAEGGQVPAAPSFRVVEDRFVSKARVVFLGHGADELFGGYSRHRTRFTKGGWPALSEEIQLDVRRIWERNFGRDDRVVSDRGKEGRLPFMDERVIHFALTSPLSSLVDFSQPAGVGDKRILRACLRALGLERASRRVKRAMQFGTRLAKASNEAMFGSNTQANRRHGGGRARAGHESDRK